MLTRTRFAALLIAALVLPVAQSPAQGPPRGISIADVTVQEPGGGFGQMDFVVTVVRDTTVAASAVTVQFRGVSGTAQVGTGGGCQTGDDVVVQASAVTILANSTTGHIFATTCSDGRDEADAESFTIELFSPSGATIVDGSATGTLLDADALPSLRVNDVSVVEGNPGSGGTATFTITLSPVSGRAVTVLTSTQNGTATGSGGCGGNTDFVSRSNIAETIPAGATTKTVTVAICGDAVFEPSQTFSLVLSSPSNATLQDGTGTGTITNDDVQPVLSIAGGATVVEGNAGPSAQTVTVSLNTGAHGGVSVTLTASGLATVGGTCTGNVDATVAGGSSQVLQWAAGDGAAKTVAVNVCGDTRDDDDTENLDLTLSAPGGGAAVVAGGSTAHFTISDDDALPQLTVGDVAVTEPPNAFTTTTATVDVTLSTASNRDVDLSLATALLLVRLPNANFSLAKGGVSCTTGVDFVSESFTAHIAAGQTTLTRPMRISICGDALREGTGAAGSVTAGKEAFSVQGSAPVHATFAKAIGTVVIVDP